MHNLKSPPSSPTLQIQYNSFKTRQHEALNNYQPHTRQTFQKLTAIFKANLKYT